MKKNGHETSGGKYANGNGAEEQAGFMAKLRKGLSRTREILTTDIDDLFAGGRKIDDDLLEDLEELLITSDLGIRTSMRLMERISGMSSKITDAAQLKAALRDEIQKLITIVPPLPMRGVSPQVVLAVGVNGVGKTTTIGKLAAKLTGQGKKVLIAASDTFRAAAVEQLDIWAGRAGADFVHHKDNADPAAVAFDAVEASIARGVDVVLVDTAGRLHTQVNLMEQLKKIKRAVSKKLPGAPHEVLLILDATTGQNAVSQAKLFHEAIGVTGIALTKLDGTAKGGIVVSICGEMDIPLKYIGIGEQIDDLEEFDARRFVNALF